MLVLTRKKEETLHIGNDITLTILKIKGNSVQIGVEAPRHVRVLRGELSSRVDQDRSATSTERDTAPPAHTSKRHQSGNRLRHMVAQVKGEESNIGPMVQLV